MKLFKAEDKKGLEPLFCTQQPTHLLVSKVPCPKPTEIMMVPTDVYCESEKIAWCESPVTTAQLRDQTLARHCYQDVVGDYKPHFVNSHLAEILQNPRKDLVICDMGMRVGKGLLLSPAATSPIKKGDVIGLYPGELSQNSVLNAFLSRQTFSAYGLDVNSDNPFDSFPGKGYNDAMFWRNHCAFIQHAPSAEKLCSVKIDKKIRSKVKSKAVTSNLDAAALIYMGFPVVAIYALRDIEPGEHLYFDYREFWNNQKTNGAGDGAYYVFDVKAHILGKITLDNKFKLDTNHTFKVPDAKLVKDSEELALSIFEENIKNAALNYQQNFVNNVTHAIQLHLKRKPMGVVLEWLTKMSSLPTANPDDLHKEISLIVEDPDFLNILKPLAKELMLFLEAFKLQQQLLNIHSVNLEVSAQENIKTP